jgi:hypothetical protein
VMTAEGDRALESVRLLELQLVDLHQRRELLVAWAYVEGATWGQIGRLTGLSAGDAERRFRSIVTELTRRHVRRAQAG